MRYDIAIVGYGPVGQALALYLGRAGHSVAVFELSKTVCGQPRAGHLDGEIMRLLQNLGLAHDLEPLFQQSSTYDLVDKDFNVLRESSDHGASSTGWHHSYLFYQPDIEAALDTAIHLLDNVDVFLGVPVVGIEQDASGAHLLIERDGGLHTVTASFAVGADGARSQVRDWLGLHQQDLGFEPAEYLVIDIKHKDPTVEIPLMAHIRQVLDPARPHMASRWNGTEHSRAEFAVMPGDDPAEIVKPEHCWKLLEEAWGIDRANTELVRSTVYTFRAKLTNQFRAGRFFLAGDSAHLMPPFLGQGLCAGLRDAGNLGWRLDLVLRGLATHSLLDGYTPERSRHVRSVIRASAAMADICTGLDPATMDEEARETFRKRTLADFDRVLFDGTVAEGAALAGEYFIQGRVHQDGTTAKLDDLLGYRWRVISPKHIDLSVLDPELREWSTSFIDVVRVSRGRLPGVAIDIDATYARWFETKGVDLVIERPDHYLFGAGSLSELSKLLEQLRDAIGRPQ